MPPRSPARVLVIDDDEFVRTFMVELLRVNGFQAFELPTPIGATNTIINQAIDAVVIDVNMPTMSGDKLAALLNNNRRLEHVGVVLVSGCSKEELAEIASTVDASGIVDKTQLETELTAAVRLSIHK